MNNTTLHFLRGGFSFVLLLTISWSYSQISYSTYHQKNNTSKLHFNPVLFVADSIAKHIDIQSFALETNLNFRYSDLIQKGTGDLADSLVLDFNRFRKALDKKNYLDISGEVLLVQFGFVSNPEDYEVDDEIKKRMRSYYGFGIRQRVTGRFSFDQNYIELLTQGNGPFYDQNFSTGHARINSSVYSELSATYAREINNKLWLGLRLKYLLGGFNITTNKLALSLRNIELDNELEVGAQADIRVSGPIESTLDAYDLVDEISVDSPSQIFSTDNPGYAVDLGLVYTVSPKLVLSAAVTDIGQIRWKNEVKQLTLDTTYRYTGADFSDSIDDQADNYKSPEDVLDELTEDIKNEFSFQLAEDSYTEKVPYTISMGAEFRVLKNLDFGAMYARYASPYYKRDTYAFSANLGIRNALSLSPTMMIVGGDTVWACAAAFRFGPLQFHMAINDFGGIATPADAQGIGIQMGMSYVFPFALIE
ncbi:MAG: hypothetical protein GWP32_08795 [Bacteroidetes bacterium]|nr:hypothetical protein [Bacteroidota bacterium]